MFNEYFKPNNGLEPAVTPRTNTFPHNKCSSLQEKRIQMLLLLCFSHCLLFLVKLKEIKVKLGETTTEGM